MDGMNKDIELTREAADKFDTESLQAAVLAAELNADFLRDEVERLKAENDAYRRTLSATVEERNRAEAQLAAIRKKVSEAESKHEALAHIEHILNTNQPQEGK